MILQKNLGGRILKCSPQRVVLTVAMNEEIRGAMTRGRVRTLIKKGILKKLPVTGTSRSRARQHHAQKMKGRSRGQGSRKGTVTARRPSKRRWIETIRLQREYLQSLKERKLLTKEQFLELYKKSQGGFFRSQRHISIYAKERGFLS